MKPTSTFAGALIGALLLVVGNATPAYAASPEDEVKAAYGAWDAAFNKADGKAVAAYYTGDALFLPGSHEVIMGPEGVDKFFSGLFANGVSGHKLELIQAMSEGKTVVSAAKWSANGKDASGKPTSFGGVATHVFERQSDGSLKLKLHTFN